MREPSSQRRERKRSGRRFENALTPAFVRKVAKAGRYADGCRLFPASRS